MGASDNKMHGKGKEDTRDKYKKFKDDYEESREVKEPGDEPRNNNSEEKITHNYATVEDSIQSNDKDTVGIRDGDRYKKFLLEDSGSTIPGVGNTEIPGVGSYDWKNILNNEPTKRNDP